MNEQPINVAPPTEADMQHDLSAALEELRRWRAEKVETTDRAAERANVWVRMLFTVLPVAVVRAVHAEASVKELEAERDNLKRLLTLMWERYRDDSSHSGWFDGEYVGARPDHVVNLSAAEEQEILEAIG